MIWCREMGWKGFEDPGFRTFVKRVTKEENPQFLTKKQLSNVIAGLTSWIANRRKQATPGASEDQA